jgi:PIN domain nuclease of toxin-antitoxin system
VALSGCLEKENPVAKLQPEVVQDWLQENESAEIVNCASIWAEGENATSGQISSCAEVQSGLAAKMNTSGLTNQEVEAEDFNLPAVWKTYLVRHTERVKKRAEVEAKIKKMRGMIGY